MANAVRENTFLSIELDQVINKVNVLRDAMERLKPITKS